MRTIVCGQPHHAYRWMKIRVVNTYDEAVWYRVWKVLSPTSLLVRRTIGQWLRDLWRG